jgi:hypothetical protein
MNQDDVMALFIEESERPSRPLGRQNDPILLLAKVAADSSENLSTESFNALVHIGGAIYKTWTAQARARSELASTMKESIESVDPNLEPAEERRCDHSN